MKGKRLLAILGIVILLGAMAAPMITAFGTGENAPGYFRAALGVAILVPVLAYGMMLIIRVFGKKEEPAGKIKNIVFDVGQVLVDFDWKGYLASFGFPKEEEEILAKEIFMSPLWNERDRSDKEEEEYVEGFVSHAPQYEADIRRVMATSDKTIRQRDYAKTWTKYLKSKGYHLFILSNYATRPLEQTKPDMAFLENMEGEIWSCDVKKIKPEPEIYEILLSRYHLKPEETVFMDDNPRNCEGARKAGMHAFVFESFKQAVSELEKLGVS
ncbi:MAG: HAD family phosphatase [Blautia sp.]|nr:HAD family phosphatase [Blautia sp.]